MDRRTFLGTSAAAAVIAAAPVAALAAPFATSIPKSWVVGSPGEYDWAHCWGETEHEAKLDWLVGHVGDCTCEHGHEVPGDECDCEVCYNYRGIKFQRVESWDGKKDGEIHPADWLRADLGALCSRCGYESDPENAHPVGNEAVCDDCMKLEDWDLVDPERAAEMRAELAELDQ